MVTKKWQKSERDGLHWASLSLFGRGCPAANVHALRGFHRLCNLFARPYSQKEGQSCLPVPTFFVYVIKTVNSI